MVGASNNLQHHIPLTDVHLDVKFGECRATTVALRNAECVHLVSVGNLLHNEARIAVIACPYDEEVRAAERGYCYETYNPSR